MWTVWKMLLRICCFRYAYIYNSMAFSTFLRCIVFGALCMLKKTQKKLHVTIVFKKYVLTLWYKS